jgi:hypothetical protein
MLYNVQDQRFSLKGGRVVDASPDLSVKVINDRDIVVTMPGSGFEVTYRKDGTFPMLMATDMMREDPDPKRLTFLVRAWKATHQKAKALGWLNS